MPEYHRVGVPQSGTKSGTQSGEYRRFGVSVPRPGRPLRLLKEALILLLQVLQSSPSLSEEGRTTRSGHMWVNSMWITSGLIACGSHLGQQHAGHMWVNSMLVTCGSTACRSHVGQQYVSHIWVNNMWVNRMSVTCWSNLC